jgi:hypothetical protein
LTAGFLTTTELAWFALLFWTAAFALVGLRLLASNTRYGEALRTVMLVTGIVAVIGVALLFLQIYVTTQRPLAVVTAFETPIRSGPGTAYVELFTLFPAAEMRLLETRDDWGRFVLPDGRQGWVMLDAVETIHPMSE